MDPWVWEGIYSILLILSSLLMIGVVWIVSVPLHEICHWIFIKLLGCKNKLEIRLLTFTELDGLCGYVAMEFNNDGSILLPKRFPFYSNKTLIGFCIGLSGGAGCAILLAVILRELSLIVPIGFLWWACAISFIAVIIWDIIYAISEAIDLKDEWGKRICFCGE